MQNLPYRVNASLTQKVKKANALHHSGVPMKPKAVVLTSGGLDSTTCIAVAIQQGFEVIGLTFDYGQRHRVELEAAERVRRHYDIQNHHLVQLSILQQLGGSALTDDIEIPKADSTLEITEDIPVTYVPARNLLFLSYATAVAEAVGAADLFIGVNALDYSGYPDCRPEFIHAFTQTANLATKAGVDGAPLTIHCPLLELTKAEIIRLGQSLGAPYHLTHSCYDPDENGRSCGHCDSCLLRLKGFNEAGTTDPIPYLGQGVA